MRKKLKRKWNRTHKFMRRKSGNLVGHPVYVYGQNSRNYKYLTFTHTPKKGEEDDYDELLHNIDPDKEGVEATYVKKRFNVGRLDLFRDPDKKYRIHPDDIPKIKKYKK